jgi:hypothetical protein
LQISLWGIYHLGSIQKLIGNIGKHKLGLEKLGKSHKNQQPEKLGKKWERFATLKSACVTCKSTSIFLDQNTSQAALIATLYSALLEESDTAC